MTGVVAKFRDLLPEGMLPCPQFYDPYSVGWTILDTIAGARLRRRRGTRCG